MTSEAKLRSINCPRALYQIHHKTHQFSRPFKNESVDTRDFRGRKLVISRSLNAILSHSDVKMFFYLNLKTFYLPFFFGQGGDFPVPLD